MQVATVAPGYRPLTENEQAQIEEVSWAKYPGDSAQAEARRETLKFRLAFSRSRLRSVRAWIEAFCRIKGTDGRVQTIKLNQCQRLILADIIREGRRREAWVDAASGQEMFRKEGRRWRSKVTGELVDELPDWAWGKLERRPGPVQLIVLKARQVGASTLIQMLIGESCIRGQNVSAKVMSSYDESTAEIFEMQLRLIEGLPIKVATRKRSRNDLEIVYGDPLGSKVTTGTAMSKVDPGRGGTYQVGHFTEVGEWEPRAHDLMGALNQTLHIVPGTLVAVESTARGAQGWFYQQWMAAERGENDYLPIFIPWFLRPDSWEYQASDQALSDLEADMDNPRYCVGKEETKLLEETYFRPGYGKVYVSMRQLAWRRFVIRNKCSGQLDMFHQEYPAYPHEAFLSTGRPVFDQRVIHDRIRELRESPEAPEFCGDLSPIDWPVFLRTHDPLEFFEREAVPGMAEDRLGPLRIWERPKRGLQYCISADTSEGVRGGDYSAIYVMELSSGSIVAAYHGLINPIGLARTAARLGWWYNVALIGPEKNNHGYTMISHLVEPLLYPNLFTRQARATRGQPSVEDFGWVTNPQTRKQMFNHFRTWLLDNEQRIPDLDLLLEMQPMFYDAQDKEKCPDRNSEGNPAHDDRVMAAGIALQIREEAFRLNLVEEEPMRRLTEAELEEEDMMDLINQLQVRLPEEQYEDE